MRERRSSLSLTTDLKGAHCRPSCLRYATAIHPLGYLNRNDGGCHWQTRLTYIHLSSMDIKYTWREAKRLANLEKHRLDFIDADYVIESPYRCLLYTSDAADE